MAKETKPESNEGDVTDPQGADPFGDGSSGETTLPKKLTPALLNQDPAELLSEE